jgi:hypothetical protein
VAPAADRTGLVAIMANYFAGDDEPACEPTDRELAEIAEAEFELAELERQAEAWQLSQPEDTDGCE